MSGSDPRMWPKERKLYQKATGDRSIESAKDLDRWAKKNGKLVVKPSEREEIIKRGKSWEKETLSDDEAVKLAEEAHDEHYGVLPGGDKIVGLIPGRLVVRRIVERMSKILEVPGEKDGCRAIVEKMGPEKLSVDGSRRVASEVRVGDEVVMMAYGGIKIEDGRVVIDEDEILAVVKR